jgi:transcriptional regulator with XRE-family HTH domain
MIINKESGIKLRKLRENLNLSRTTIQEKIEISESSIKLWETGTISLNSKIFKKYLAFLGNCGFHIDLEWLLSSDEQQQLSPRIDQISYVELTNKGKVFITDVIKLLEQVSNFCYYLDSDEQVVYFNRKVIPFLVSDPERLYNSKKRTLQDISHMDMYEICIKNYREALNSKMPISFDYKMNHPIIYGSSDKSRYYKMQYIPMQGVSQEIIGVMAFVSEKSNE